MQSKESRLPLKLMAYKGDAPLGNPKAVVCIGNFDGLHLGHQKVIQTALEVGRVQNLPTTVLTFRPHPQEALRPNQRVELLLTYDEKIELIQAVGANQIVELPFDSTLSQMPAEEFFTQVLVKKLGAKQIVVGYDFAFGQKRGGTQEVMKRLCGEYKIGLTVVPAFSLGGKEESRVSSSSIRKVISEGRLEEANLLLGRPFFFKGLVIQGDQRGRTLGFPTANILPSAKKLLPPLGVYCTEATLGEKNYSAITNIGMRPTIEPRHASGVLIETHLLISKQEPFYDFYGQLLQVHFLKFLRPEKKFSALEELKTQIQQDIESARRFFELR